MFKFKAIKELNAKQPLKHWTNGRGWEMVELVHNIIFNSIKIIV
jgi:hypothetical protein